MKSRLTPCLLSALLVMSISRFDACGQDAPAPDNRDLVELLEMQLSDAQKENARLASELEKQNVSGKGKVSRKAEAASATKERKLKEENAELKKDLTRLDRDLKAAGKSRDALASKLEDEDKAQAKLASEVALLQKKLAGIEKDATERGGDVGDEEELKARCKNLEDENAIIMQESETLRQQVKDAEAARAQTKADFDRMFREDDGDRTKRLMSDLEEMKAIETQRKAAFDDLFKQLADTKGRLTARDSEIASLRAEIEKGREGLRAKERELDESESQLVEMQSAAKTLRKQVEAVAETLASVEETVAKKDVQIRDEEAARQAAEMKLDRIKLTDDQRKKAMDDILTKLAAAERLNAERADRVALLERQLEDAKTQGTDTISGLESRTAELNSEVARLQESLRAAVSAKTALSSKVEEHEAGAERDAEKIVGMEADLARVKATDNQRRKAMDKLLLEIASLEELSGSLRGDLAAARQEVDTLKARPAVNSDAVSTDASAELDRLVSENHELRKTVAALEAEEPAVAASPVADDGDDDTAAPASMQKKWQADSAKLEKRIAELQQASDEQSQMVSSLKADLAEAERMKAQLADEAKQLRNRKVDVRSTDLFKELERVNEVFRDKLKQIEGERQRLAKSVKKLEKRDGAYDDEIAHEQKMRQDADTALADARAREVEYQGLIERLTAQVPQLEKQLAAVEDGSRKLQQTLVDREEDLRALKIELEKREHRLIKAERVAEVLEGAREDILHASDKEKLDMHYNVAAVYAREGKFVEAEQEYLHALRLDPLDADVHYNLGILYDDELNSPVKAGVHYRRYLKLNPHGMEADQVRDWLMKLEMKMKQ
ncbi:MAG: tetratricopeptide repeat protein [Verrucomicrobia bacterium]|nr:tetratricopeptide repeat protein [Verrucomicrobiota bacterium]